jgi:hypothetical protein
LTAAALLKEKWLFRRLCRRRRLLRAEAEVGKEEEKVKEASKHEKTHFSHEAGKVEFASSFGLALPLGVEVRRTYAKRGSNREEKRDIVLQREDDAENKRRCFQWRE